MSRSGSAMMCKSSEADWKPNKKRTNSERSVSVRCFALYQGYPGDGRGDRVRGGEVFAVHIL